MTERLVQIPLEKETRNLIKESKRELTYDEFFRKVLGNRTLEQKGDENG